MDEAEAYLKRANKIRYQTFRGGYVSASQKPDAPIAGQTISAGGPAVTSTPLPVGVLPPKKTKKRARSPETAEPPAPPTTLNASGKPKRSLMEKWFPGITLIQATVEVGHAPPPQFVAATVERITRARETMILLKSGVEDVDAVLDELRAASPTASATSTAGRSSSKADVRQLVTCKTAPGIGEALGQFAQEQAHDVKRVRAQLWAMLRQKSSSQTPKVSSVKAWHTFLNTHGPEANEPPALADFLWLSSVDTTTLFTVLVQRFLRGLRDSTDAATGKPAASVPVAYHGEVTKGRLPEDTENAEGESLPKLFIAEEEEDHLSTENRCWLQETQPRLCLCDSTAEGESPAVSSVTEAQAQLLVFLRFLMPTREATPLSPEGGSPRTSCGYGVWLLACLATLDIPLNPDTDRLVHDLFRTCCDQVRVLGEWSGTHGDQPGQLLAELRRREAQRTSGHVGTEERWPKRYISMEDIGPEELLALYTVIVILAKLFRQNQNRLIQL